RGKLGRRDGGTGVHKTRGRRTEPHEATRSGHGAPRGESRLTEARDAGSGSPASAVRHGSIVEGTVSANRAGYGFVRVEGLKESVFLPPPEMRGVMHGDRLRVKVSRDASDRWSGAVEQVLERGVTAFLGTVEVQGRSAWVNAADRRLQLRCAVAPQDLHDARHGDWVIARITRHAGSATPAQAVIGKRLDPDRPVELATESAIARSDLPHEFPAAALREAQAYGEQVDSREASARADLRELPLVTIDGEDARDFDDAVYAERCPGGFRLTDALANDALFAGRPAARTQLGPLLEPLMVLVDVYRALYQARNRRGALDFDAAEAEFVIDAGERVRSIELRTRNDAHRLIEECMILANVAVAEALERAQVPTLYRVHGQPEDEKLERLMATLRALGIDARIPKSVSTRDLQAIARRVGNAPERAFVESLVVRAMPQANYQPTNIGHFGLALAHYAHFTSPIRRYPDLVVHRTLKAMIGAPGGSGRRYETS